jgi:hypothetical protein
MSFALIANPIFDTVRTEVFAVASIKALFGQQSAIAYPENGTIPMSICV